MGFLTQFGDAIVTLALAAAILLWLAVFVGSRLAAVWGGAVLLAGGGTALLKIYFSACGTPLDTLQSPSGHTSMSTLVYGGLALILGAEAGPWQRLTAGAAGAALVLAIAASRVLLGAHSLVEIGVGLLIGAAALALFARRLLAARPMSGQVWTLVLAAAALAFLLHGHEAELEPVWARLAALFRDTTGLCRA
jgi:membrane-associated phospholipid phosphatase